jgi:hypothetical protein
MSRGMCETVVVAAFGEKFEAPARANLCGSVRTWTETWGASAMTCLFLAVQRVSRTCSCGRVQGNGCEDICFGRRHSPANNRVP